MIKRIVKLTFQQERADDFLAIFRESKKQILGFPGCQHLELLRCTQPDNIFFTYSFWDDETALERYRQSELFRSTWSRTKKLFADRAHAWSVEEWE
ncbi:MAG: antibiotic biosynthesis monooxygenase [Phaeodactylibacter sp.]|nr:antibiotic biosynthesis monooxygenase [Phaeodactylibacter sp.]MCB9265511.1 antibiotic biosynthesis monooxygenase [Lewinellaceae bacterium]MCB9289555.1 antibiotic biosynthesis monooxygenase [Lewinellaceae bacterium]